MDRITDWTAKRAGGRITITGTLIGDRYILARR